MQVAQIYSFFEKTGFKKLAIFASLFFIGITYFSLHSYEVGLVKHKNQRIELPFESRSGKNTKHVFNVKLNSWFAQEVLLNIAADDKIEKVLIDNTPVRPSIAYPRTRTTYLDVDYGDVYPIALKAGTTELVIHSFNTHGTYTLKLKQKYTLLEYLFAFMTLVFPLAYIGFHVFLLALSHHRKVWRHVSRIPIAVHIIWIAILIRAIYFWDMGYITFQHDYQGHREYIKFFAQYFTIPLPHKGWEYPQQPLYYVVTGTIYHFAEMFGFEQKPALKIISGVTTALSCIALIYAYRLVRQLTEDKVVHNLTMGFLAFTPSLIYMSSRINNDPWAASLAIIALFYIVASYKTNFQRYLWPALISTSLVFLTKISSLGIEIFFLMALFAAYFKTPEKVRAPLFNYAWVGLLILGYTLFRAYYPASGTFVFVNSGIWPGQDLRPLDAGYFMTFHYFDIFEQAQSHIREKDTDNIKFSFLSYQFGTMLFGQFDYEHWRKNNYMLTFNMQLIILFAITIPLGWISYCFTQKNLIDKFFIAVVAITVILVLKFIFDYPSISNTDFRYYATIFFMQAYFFAVGISYLMRKNKWLRKILVFSCSALFGVEILYMINLISV